MAQTLPPATDSDLLLPPGLRAGAPALPPERADRDPRLPKATARTKSADPRKQPASATATRSPESRHPVDVGVVMRGGSGTPRLVSPLGTTQAVQESGSAFGAGMRIGF